MGILPAYAFFRRKTTGSQVAILLYHRVSPAEGTSLVPTLTPELFDIQIGFLKKRFQLISLETLGDMLTISRELPKKAVAITFDDGYKDIFVFAYPILKKHDVPATIFLSTGCVNNSRLFWWDLVDYCIQNYSQDRIKLQGIGEFMLSSESQKDRAKKLIVDILKKIPDNEKEAALNELTIGIDENILHEAGKDMVLSWSEIKEMANNGITFGAHTVNHPILTQVPIETCRSEILQSKKDIEAVLGTQVTCFSYPNGTYNSEITRIVKEAGFTCATTTSSGLMGKKDNIFALKRICVSENFDIFKGMLSGISGDFGFIYYR